MNTFVAIVGKPNVGKSTFFNKIFNSNISKVENCPGTTKQVIEKSLSLNNKNIVFLDTGGLKKKSKSNKNNQKFITKECLTAINKSSIVIFVVDATDKFTKNDKQICRLVLNKLKSLIVIINKSDLVQHEFKSKILYFDYYFKNLFSDVIVKPYFFSSIGKKQPKIILDEICMLIDSSKVFINTSKINLFLKHFNLNFKAPMKGRFRPKVKYLKQVSTSPIILKAFGSSLQEINRDYKNFFLKKFLYYFNIYNKVVIIKFINNKNPFN